MCGIVGGWFTKTFEPGRIKAFELALARLQHRGPNDRGLEFFNAAEGVVVFGHTRLSIIDLSSGGHQPLASGDNRYSLIFNGEIFNYRELREELKSIGRRFFTTSDTEVLLASWIVWGQNCLTRLRGMFSFVVYDKIAGSLVCARDAFGIKPFFYQANKHSFLFASEIPALLSVSEYEPYLNIQRACNYLVYGNYDDGDDTFFQGIKQLPPGHLLTFKLALDSFPIIERWWWPDINERHDLSFADATEQLRSMFLENIRLHMRSDVPLGAALSGGVDSSAVVCAMRHVEKHLPINTFTYVAKGSDTDEERWADVVNAYVGAISHKVVVTADELARDLDDLIIAQGEPFGGTSIYAQYRVFQLARNNGVTVTLDGQGADELLAGYAGYPGPTLLSYIEKGRLSEFKRFLWSWSKMPGRSKRYAFESLIAEILPDSLHKLGLQLSGRYPLPTWLNKSILIDNKITLNSRSLFKLRTDSSGRRLVDALRASLAGNGLNSLLRHGDRNSMRWSVESRVPFLTTDIAEFLLRLPECYLVSQQGITKHIFREAMRGIVPDSILNRKDKIGFATPERDLMIKMGNKLIDWIEVAEIFPFLKVDKCKNELIKIVNGKLMFGTHVWRLINFCRWAQLIGIKAC